MPGVSVLIPVYNEEPNIAPLVDAVRTAMGSGPDWELLLVDDGSSDGTVDRIRAAATADPRIRLIPLARNYGQTTALQAGFDYVRGAAVVTHHRPGSGTARRPVLGAGQGWGVQSAPCSQRKAWSARP